MDEALREAILGYIEKKTARGKGLNNGKAFRLAAKTDERALPGCG